MRLMFQQLNNSSSCCGFLTRVPQQVPGLLFGYVVEVMARRCGYGVHLQPAGQLALLCEMAGDACSCMLCG